MDLPPIEARPPIPPRVYKRLFTHLDNILPGRQSRGEMSTPKTPRNQRPLGSAVPSSQPRTLDRSISRSATRITPKQITLVHTPTKSTSKGFVGRVDPAVGLHPWIRGVLGVLISETGRQRWGRHVLAGVQAVIAPSNKRTADPWIVAHLPATVAAIFAASMFAVDSVVLGARVRAQDDVAERTVEIMRRARRELDVKGMSDEEFWDGWRSLSAADVEVGMARVEDDWARGEWFAVLLEAAEADRDAELEAARAKGPSSKKARLREVREKVRRADSMHLEKYGFLDRERREAYAEWKEDVLARIEAAETAGPKKSAAAADE